MKLNSFVALALALAAGTAHAEDAVWVAQVAVDGRSTIEIVDVTAAGCGAQVVQYANAVVVESCHAEIAPQRIVDDNDYGRGSGRVIRRRPSNIRPNP